MKWIYWGSVLFGIIKIQYKTYLSFGCDASHGKEWRMVGGEDRGVSSDNGRDERVTFEFLVKELPYLFPVPSFRMDESLVE